MSSFWDILRSTLYLQDLNSFQTWKHVLVATSHVHSRSFFCAALSRQSEGPHCRSSEHVLLLAFSLLEVNYVIKYRSLHKTSSPLA